MRFPTLAKSLFALASALVAADAAASALLLSLGAPPYAEQNPYVRLLVRWGVPPLHAVLAVGAATLLLVLAAYALLRPTLAEPPFSSSLSEVARHVLSLPAVSRRECVVAVCLGLVLSIAVQHAYGLFVVARCLL